MARGLQFDPYGNLGFSAQGNNQSVPTVVDDYNQGFGIKPIQLPRINPDSPLVKAWNNISAWNNMSDEEKEDFNLKADPMYNINRWNNGLSGLPDDERELWKQQNYTKINGKSEEDMDRIWRNQQFINDLGLDTFTSMKGRKEDRDKLYMDYLTGSAVKKKFGNNQNFEQLMGLTPEGRMELLNSDYQADWQMRNKDKEAEEKGWLDYSLGERWNAISSDVPEYTMAGMGTGSLIGAAAEGVGSIPGAVIGSLVGLGTGLVKGIASPEDAADINTYQRRKENDEILNKIQVSDNERKKSESQEDISSLYSNYLRAYNQGQISSSEVDQMFDNIALSGKKTSVDELGNVNEYDYNGSSYYTAFKDSDEFEHFGTLDKLRYIAQSQVLAQKYGMGSAISVLDQDMQNIVSNNQSGWTWAGNTAKNIFVGGVANLGMNITALGALGAELVYGEEGLANYLKGKDASGDGTDNGWLNNPQYWNKVDQYNTFGWDHWYNPFSYNEENMSEVEKNGGLSPYNNVYAPGSEGDFWSWSTLNESLKMSKFAWSDMLKNLALAKVVRGATRVTGGVEIAPGRLATESSMASKAINKAGAFGVLNASSLGIDAAYGMQTYENVLRENNSRLDKIIDQDTEAEVQRRLQTEEAQKEFRQAVDAENERRRKRAGEKNPYIAVDEDQAFLDYTEHLRRQVRQEQEALHQEDRQQAENDAANAYAIDASVEHLRMASTNAAFKSYLFDKGTLNALKSNNPYVNVTTKNGQYALARHATRDAAMKTLGTNIWGGFHSNYFDDVTVGFAEGFGIQDYNNYLLQKYNPAAYGSVMDDYVNPFLAGVAGATNAMQEKRSFLDGAIGAVGSVFTFTPNIGGMMSHRQRMKEAAEANKRNGQEKAGISWQEMASDFITNPVLQAYADAKAATRLTEAEIKRVNDIIKDNGYSFDNIVETASALNQKAIAREGTSLLEAEDAKDREAFALASSLLSLKNSGVVANAQAEPDRANWSRKKKAAAAITQGLNMLIGRDMFAPAESSYTTAMQALEDASTIGESRDEETQARQQELLQTFLGLDANKNALSGMSQEEQVSYAQERLKKNATALLDMMDRTEKLQRKFENSIQARLHPDLKQQLMYQYVLNDRWQSRLEDLEQQIKGNTDIGGTDQLQESVIAKYGSMQGYERTAKAQEKRVTEAREAYKKAKAESKKENDPTKSIVENARQKAVRLMKERAAKRALDKEMSAMNSINADESRLKSALESEAPVISRAAILNLNPNDRLRMLDDFYRNDYSAEQQREIDAAKDMLIADGSTINEAMERVKDAAILSDRIEDNMEAAKRIMQNPVEANMMQQALVDNRRKAVIDYFNDKIVAEAFQDFVNDPTATLNDESVANKASGYSTAVLNGMLREIEKTMGEFKRVFDVEDKTLKNMEDGIKQVLSQRDEKLEETADLDKFIRKTKKVNHTETVPVTIKINDEQEVPTSMSEQVTTERELSDNDRRLLDDALDYAAERGIPVEDLAQEVMTEDFDKYVQEKNHSYELGVNPMTGEVSEVNVGTVDNRANPVSPQYMSDLVSDVVSAFKQNKDAVTTAKADKPTAAKPESVATAPVETKGSKAETREEEARPDEVDPNDPFGLKKKKNTPTPSPIGTKPATAAPVSAEPDSSRNTQIMEDASTLNSGILEDVGILLDTLDNMSMPDQTREKLKDIIASNLNSRTFSNIAELQNRIMEDSIITSETEAPLIAVKGTALAGMNIADIKARKAGEGNTGSKNADSAESNSTHNPLPPAPLILETRDLDMLMNYPIWKNYIQSHNVIGFLQKLADLWNQELEAWRKTGKQGYLHQSQVVFVYDPALAEQVKGSIEENGGYYNPEISSPIIMALEITDKNRHLVDDEAQLISIKDKTDNKVHQYQAIGFMPASEVSTSDSQTTQATAMRMAALRNRVNYNDTEAHVLRYAPKNDTGKYNGTPIRTNIEKVSSHTEEGLRPEGTKETPRTGVQQLMDENLNSATEAFVSATDYEKASYDYLKTDGDMQALRQSSLYKKLRKAFIERLFKRERPGRDADDPTSKELNFRLQKGTNDTYPKIVLVKKVSETLDKNSGRPIIDILRGVDSSDSSTWDAKEVIESNSRFKRLFNQLGKLKISSGLFNQNGEINNKSAYDKALREYEESVRKTIDNNLHVDELGVRVEISEGLPSEKTISIRIWSGNMNDSNNLLSTLTTKYTGQISQGELAAFLKDLILDKEGNPRPGLNDSRYERVKWQVNYEDAVTANDESKTAVERKYATDNLNDLYDDGVFEMQVTKLAYPSRSVTVSINPTMSSRLYPERKSEPEIPVPAATEQHAAHEAETPVGKADGDTGMATETPSRETVMKGIPRVIIDTINRMLSDSKTRQLTDDGRHYSIGGQLWSRVTSIKHALEGFVKDRFDPNSSWATPSSLIGNSFDEFGRDVLNGVFDVLKTDADREAAFGTYDNSTAKNYAEAYMALKAFEARLAAKGQAVIATGNRENPGHITAKGTIDVTVKGENGIETRKVRVAGTLDILAIDSQGNLHIYDFKTYHSNMNADIAVEKGYDRQLSMYAKFLEEEYGLKVKSINILPINSPYPSPSQKTYRQQRPGSNQLEVKDPTADDSKYEAFEGAAFKVEKEFPLTRLSDTELVASYDRMTDTEKEALVEAIQDQSETPATDTSVKAEDIASAKPDAVNEAEEEEEGEGGFSRKGSRFGRRRKKSTTESSEEEVTQAISPNDSNGLLNRLKDLENACGGKKK